MFIIYFLSALTISTVGGEMQFYDYETANDRNCHLYKVGLAIPDCDGDYKDFTEKIIRHEMMFREKVHCYCP